MKKKIIGVMLTAVLVAGLTACGNSGSGSTTSDSTNTETADTTTETAADATENETQNGTEGTENSETNAVGTGKTLVVYYSATGTTEGIANMIAETTGGDVFELEPVEPYTNDDLNWRDGDSRVSVEHDNEDQRDVPLTAATVDNWDEYDTVYIGYPIWWAIAAWPVNEFIESNNFDGKTVIPFATAATSGLGESGQLLEEMAGTGTWLEGECFRSNDNSDDVKEWIDSLRL